MIDKMVPVHCTDNGKETAGYILSIMRNKFMEVSMNTVKVRLTYNSNHKQYVGSMAGLEFVVNENDLPKYTDDIKTFRRSR
jgi:hypothetical protein